MRSRARPGLYLPWLRAFRRLTAFVAAIITTIGAEVGVCLDVCVYLSLCVCVCVCVEGEGGGRGSAVL